MSKKILLATHNLHKIEEIAAILKKLAIDLVSLADFPDLPEVEEDGKTFAQNALKKARVGSIFSGFTCLSDDSGLVVKALKGEPGVYSARYAGLHASDAANNKKLLAQLRGIPAAERQASFICCLALVNPAGQTQIFTGTANGEISSQPRGKQGFGYDPLFIPQGYQSTFGEMPAELKNHISHRTQAIAKLVEFLRQHSDFVV